jgi:hypothetical protein
VLWGTRWRSWLRHYATSRKVTGSIPDGVTGICHWHNPSSCTMALGLTQLLAEMSTRNISWGVEVAGAQLHVPTVLKSGSLNLLEPSGPVQACNGIALPLPLPWYCASKIDVMTLVLLCICDSLRMASKHVWVFWNLYTVCNPLLCICWWMWLIIICVDK